MEQVFLDSVWVLVCAFLVFFMHAGFALLEGGFVRKKNVVMVLLKNLGVVALSSVLFYLVGFGVMFGEGGPVMGLTLFAPEAAGEAGGLPTFVFLFFQLMFAATACTIVSGAIAERARLSTFFVFVAMATALVYPLVGHWIWSGEAFLTEMGFHDFAGSTVVHAVGGAMALAGVLMIGPRIGKYGKDGAVKPMPAHSFPLAALGVLILWLGWFGFNGGSTLSANPEAVAPVILVTNLAAAAGFLAALLHVRMRTKMLDLSMALNGALAGLVGITAGADVIGPIESMLVGAMAGVLVVEGVFLLDKLKWDDPVGAIPVHLFCGIFGTLAVGLFANTDTYQGLFHGGGFTLLGVQALGALAGTGFAFVAGLMLWFVMKKMPGGIRVSTPDELEGLDITECGVEAYGEELKGGVSPAELLPEEAASMALAPAAAAKRSIEPAE